MDYLTVPTDKDNPIGWLPPYESLDEWQQYQYQNLCEQFLHWKPYVHKKVSKSGTIGDHDFRRRWLLRAAPSIYCCGITYENFWMSWVNWMQRRDLFETDQDITFAQAKELYAYFYKFEDANNKYQYGCASGIEWLGTLLDPVVGLTTRWHRDPYQARFGAYIQIQSHQDPMIGGHSAMFVGLEQLNGKDVIRTFSGNTTTDYGLRSGVTFTWYVLDKVNAKGFPRVFHFGEFKPREDEV